MSAAYCRRLRMELDLWERPPSDPELPAGYRWETWTPELLERHANVKFSCFEHDRDGRLFQTLRNRTGCRQLMDYIANHDQFVCSATWLLVFDTPLTSHSLDCGTIQGLTPTPNLGAIQNVGILPEHRRRGLGRALMQRALLGFQQIGLRYVTLEVTTGNQAAITLYQSLGFRPKRTLFRRVEF